MTETLERLKELEANKQKGKGPFIDDVSNAMVCLQEMCSEHPALYDQCLETIGFAYRFSQLSNRAVLFDQIYPQLSSLLACISDFREVVRLWNNVAGGNHFKAEELCIALESAERKWFC